MRLGGLRVREVSFARLFAGCLCAPGGRSRLIAPVMGQALVLASRLPVTTPIVAAVPPGVSSASG